MGGYGKGKTPGIYLVALRDLKENVGHYEWVYSRLEDDRSRDVFTNLIRFRLLPSKDFLKNAYDGKHPQYFDFDIIDIADDEVFVDCGGFTGDTVESYLQHCKKYNRIYVYEPNEANIQACKKNLAAYKNIIIRQAGVGEHTSTLSLSDDGSASSFVTNDTDPNTDQITVVALDDDIPEPVTFIKMDIECFEVDGLLGAKRHIQNETPKLAICLYHIVSDMWEIPLSRLAWQMHRQNKLFCLSDVLYDERFIKMAGHLGDSVANINLMAADSSSCYLREQYFDFVVLNGAQWIDSPDDALKNAVRVIKPGGSLICIPREQYLLNSCFRLLFDTYTEYFPDTDSRVYVKQITQAEYDALYPANDKKDEDVFYKQYTALLNRLDNSPLDEDSKLRELISLAGDLEDTAIALYLQLPNPDTKYSVNCLKELLLNALYISDAKHRQKNMQNLRQAVAESRKAMSHSC